jgi:hypothetical protein
VNSNYIGSTFIDGGMGYNNPSKLARDEVTEYHRTRQDIERPIAVLLSIGTGKTGGNCGENIGRSDHYNVRRRMMAHYRRFMRDSFNRWTDGREIEADMHRLAERDGFDYYRMDAAGLGKVKLDEWKKDEATLREIRESTNIYLDTGPVTESIQRLAEQLVQARKCRKRAWGPQKIEVCNFLHP